MAQRTKPPSGGPRKFVKPPAAKLPAEEPERYESDPDYPEPEYYDAPDDDDIEPDDDRPPSEEEEDFYEERTKQREHPEKQVDPTSTSTKLIRTPRKSARKVRDWPTREEVKYPGLGPLFPGPGPAPRRQRELPPVETYESLPPLVPGWPETLVGPHTLNQSGIIHLIYFPIGRPVFAQTTGGWICQAVKEPNLPADRRSSMMLSHFSRAIKKPYALWLDGRLWEEGFDPEPLKDAIGYKRSRKEEEDIDVDPLGRKYRKPKSPGGSGWPLRWVSSTCVSWLLHQVIMVKPPFTNLRPMVTGKQQWDRLYSDMATYPPHACAMSFKHSEEYMTRKEAEDFLGIRWSTSLDQIWSAYGQAKEKWDFRRYPPEEEPFATDMEDLVDDAFVNIMARRFMQPPYHKIVSHNYPLSEQQYREIFKIVNFLVRERAVLLLRSDRRKAIDYGTAVPDWNDHEVEIRFRVLREKLFADRGLEVDNVKKSGLLERALTGLYLQYCPAF